MAMRRTRGRSAPKKDAPRGFKKPFKKPETPRPELLVARVEATGMVKVLHKDLAGLEFELVGKTLEPGNFCEVRPVGGRGKKMEFVRLVPKAGVASWAAILNHGLRVEWPTEVVKEAESLPAYQWRAEDKRRDWRKLAIVTIDGEDARDFDDAVWAESWEKGGHHIVVAIADVAHYIKENSALDKEAEARGNSTYFPDRVVPMLPERLSNDLCSLRPHEDRPVVGVEMWIDAKGKLVRHEFARGVIHSAARLTYNQVQAFLDGDKAAVGADVAAMLPGLKAAYETLLLARVERGALDFDLPEVKLEMKDNGEVDKVAVRERKDAHRLIEELMILANVAAAETFSRKGGGGLYRIHGEPTKEKLEGLRATLGPLGFTVPAANAGAKSWAKLVSQIEERGGEAEGGNLLLRAVLQAQQQAKYDPDNIGHYGLALPLYAHFTSPIRRYSDLVVHRALLGILGLGDKKTVPTVESLKRMGEHLNMTERKSQMAEWEARDRLVAQHFAGLVGEVFPAIVTSVQPFGCFVAVAGVAEGLLPKWKLWDSWMYVGNLQCWRKKTTGRGDKKGVLRVGSKVEVKLLEADALGGRLTFGLAEDRNEVRGTRNEGRFGRPWRR
jgi:ribonuclease R